MKKLKNNKGITLIALIITIVVLLILVGVTINMVIGENGLIKKGEKSVEKYNVSRIEEDVNMKLAELEIEITSKEKKHRKPTMKEIYQKFVDDPNYVVIAYKVAKLESIEIDFDKLKSVNSITVIDIKKTDVPIVISINNGIINVHAITQAENISFKYETSDGEITPDKWTNKDVKVTAILNEKLDDMIMQVSADGKNWKDGDSCVFSNNGSLYVRLINKKNSTVGDCIIEKVQNIDKQSPNGDVELSQFMTANSVMGVIGNVNNLLDDNSGIDYNNSKYVLIASNSKIGTDEKLYTDGNLTDGTIDANKVKIERGKKAGTYYMHVLLKDYAGNATEIISPTSVAVTGVKNFDYTGGVQAITLPKGNYKLECWGAQGGDDSSYRGGKGGYAYGQLGIEQKYDLTVVVGGKGASAATGTGGGYNGGGHAGTSGSSGAGGGATHIATSNRGQLVNYKEHTDELVVVAGGAGGGGNSSSATGAAGGGINGGSASGSGGTQSEGGTGNSAGSFGKGGDRTNGDGGGRRPEAIMEVELLRVILAEAEAPVS